MCNVELDIETCMHSYLVGLEIYNGLPVFSSTSIVRVYEQRRLWLESAEPPGLPGHSMFAYAIRGTKISCGPDVRKS